MLWKRYAKKAVLHSMASGINGVHTNLKKDGRLRFEEYYPNALEDTYKGIEGYIYSCSKIDPYQKLDIKIPNTFITAQKNNSR